jgi:hypothetical protein
MTGTLIIKRTSAMATAAFAAIVVANMARCVDSDGAERASTCRLHSMAHAMADLFTFTLVVAAEQLSGTNAN